MKRVGPNAAVIFSTSLGASAWSLPNCSRKNVRLWACRRKPNRPVPARPAVFAATKISARNAPRDRSGSGATPSASAQRSTESVWKKEPGSPATEVADNSLQSNVLPERGAVQIT